MKLTFESSQRQYVNFYNSLQVFFYSTFTVSTHTIFRSILFTSKLRKIHVNRSTHYEQLTACLKVYKFKKKMFGKTECLHTLLKSRYIVCKATTMNLLQNLYIRRRGCCVASNLKFWIRCAFTMFFFAFFKWQPQSQ